MRIAVAVSEETSGPRGCEFPRLARRGGYSVYPITKPDKGAVDDEEDISVRTDHG